jgi:hypothetical protein
MDDELMKLFTHSGAVEYDLSSPHSMSFVLMFLTSIFYGVMLNLIYNLYYRDSEPQDASLARSLIILTPAMMTLFWVVHTSLSLSVGLLGVLSFARFRAPIKKAEDLAFVVVCLSCAISCAIIRPFFGLALILLFLVHALIRNYFSPESFSKNGFAVLTYNTKNSFKVHDLEKVLEEANCKKYEFVSSRTYDHITSFVFNIPNLKKNDLDFITEKLEQRDNQSSINIFYPNGRLGA